MSMERRGTSEDLNNEPASGRYDDTGKLPALQCRRQRKSTDCLKPSNMAEAWSRFRDSGFSQSPQFTYDAPEQHVREAFASVCVRHNLKVQAEEILELHKICGESCHRGTERLSPDQVRAEAEAYVSSLGLSTHRVDVCLQSGLRAARVSRQKDSRGVFFMCSFPVDGTHRSRWRGLLDHELGTHLVRMVNDEGQVWNGDRASFKLGDPDATEEGLATVNQCLTASCKLLFEPALLYFSACRGAELGFCELFAELRRHCNTLLSCWGYCCRVKCGLSDASLPGATGHGQLYFQGAVEVLRYVCRHESFNVSRLYGGRLSLGDAVRLPGHMFDDVYLPPFISSAEKLERYRAHCREVLACNHL